MNACVLYDSQHGNTERIAQAIAGTLAARALRVADAPSAILDRVDLLILGCPTHGWNMTPGMGSWLDRVGPRQLHSRAVACFDTRYRRSPWLTGSAARVLDRRLRALGARPLVPPESFFVEGVAGPLSEGELTRATTWAHALAVRAAAAREAVR